MTPFDGKCVFITGGTGSFGSAFVPYLLTLPVRKVIVYSRDEYKQWAMARQISDTRLRFFLGDIRDLRRTTDAMQQADIVVHAAALKHVTAMEYNPDQAVATNILGTQNVIDAVRHSPVGKAILLSTDKACMPLNLYGTTKAVAEKLWLASNVHKPCFSFVRYGNVMESRGGVLSLWREAIAAGLPVKCTGPQMTRFWMTYPMAIEAVRYAASQEAGLAVVHKASAVVLGDLADAMAPGKPVERIEPSPGEKEHETLITSYESRRCVDVGDKYVLLPEVQFLDGLRYDIRGERVPVGFLYSSDAATKLSVEQIRGMV